MRSHLADPLSQIQTFPNGLPKNLLWRQMIWPPGIWAAPRDTPITRLRLRLRLIRNVVFSRSADDVSGASGASSLKAVSMKAATVLGVCPIVAAACLQRLAITIAVFPL